MAGRRQIVLSLGKPVEQFTLEMHGQDPSPISLEERAKAYYFSFSSCPVNGLFIAPSGGCASTGEHTN